LWKFIDGTVNIGLPSEKCGFTTLSPYRYLKMLDITTIRNGCPTNEGF